MCRVLSLILIGLFLATGAFAASGSGNVSSVINMGGLTGDGTPGSVIPNGSVNTAVSLVCTMVDGNVANGQFYPCNAITNGAVGQYVVPGGKTLYITSMCVQTNILSSANRQLLMGYGTAALGTFPSTATPPAGVVYYASKANTSVSSTMLEPVGLTSVPTCVRTLISYPTGAFPWVMIQNPVSANELHTIQLTGFTQ